MALPINLSYEENTLLQLIAQDDEEAFRQIFYRYRPRLVSFVLGLGRSAQAAEDIVHDIFLDLWRNRAKLPEIEHFSTYLFKAVRYRAHRLMERKARETLILAELRSQDDEEPASLQQDSLSLQAVKVFLRQRLEKLTPQQRKIFLLSREYGLTHAQIAQKLGIQPQTVSNHLSEALRYLRDEMNAFYGPWAVVLCIMYGIG